MSYELEIDKILAGSLNLLAPGDLGQETDAIAMHNWRIDQGGQLRSRLGMGAPVASALGTYVHTIGRVEAATPRRYYGVDTKWFRGAVSISSGFDGNPFGMVSFQGQMWAMNRSKQLKDDGTNTYNWSPTAPAAAPTVFSTGGAGTGSLNGDYDYYVTFLDANGAETNPSPVLHVTGLAADDSVEITRPAVVDLQVLTYNIYRTGGSFPTQRYKVNGSPRSILSPNYVDNGQDNTGTGGDDQTDNGIANLGVILEIDHDPAPAAKFVAGPYLGRLYGFGTAANPNRMFYTPANQPAFFPGSGTSAGGNWADIGEKGEEFIGAAIFPQVILIIKAKSVWRLIGDPTTGEIERLNIDVGGIGIKAWAVSGATVYFQAQEGIYRTSVSSTGIVSPDLVSIFKGDAVEAYGAIPAAAVDPSATARGRSAMAFVNGRLYFSYASLGGSGYPDITLVWNEKTQQWGTDSRGFTALYYEGQGGSLLGAVGGSVYPLEQGAGDNGATITPIYQTRFRNQGQPNVQKHYANLEIEHRLNGATMKVSVIFDGKASTLTQIGTITSTSDRQWDVLSIPDFNSGNEPRSIAVRIELTIAGTSYEEILSLALRYYAVPLGGVVFDSGNFKLADGRVCFVENLEIDIENTGAGQVSYEWQSDLPGNAVVSRVTANLAAVGVGSFRVAPGVKEARWARLIVRSTKTCRVFGARVQIRPIGLYLQGTGDNYATAELACGSPRLKLFSKLRFAAQADGAIPAHLSTDTPPGAGTALTIVKDTSIPATTDRQWFEQALSSNTRGKLLRISLDSTAIARIFQILVRTKVLGDSSSAWQWFEVPITPTPDEWQWLDIPIAK